MSDRLHNTNADIVIAAERAKGMLLFREHLAPGVRIEMDVKTVFATTQSEFQKVDVIETYFGKTLVTDGKTQSALFDEFAYHESLVHPAMLKAAGLGSNSIRPPASPVRTVFIGGGGELATAREVLRHQCVERIVMVDIDATVLELCRQYLPEWGGDAVATHPKLELVVGDAHAYLRASTDQFDVIIMDISDPIEAGPGIQLYTKEFYDYVRQRLAPLHGVFVTQAGMAESVPVTDDGDRLDSEPSCFAPIYNTLRASFDCVVPYTVSIPSFGGDWGMIMAYSAGGDANSATRDSEQVAWTTSTSIDEAIETQIEGGADALRWYDGETHRRMFAISKPLRNFLKGDDRIMTRDNPIFMY